MPNCDPCIKLNPIPGCIDSEVFLLTGLTFPAFANTTISAMLKDMANGREVRITVVIDGSGSPTFDVADQYRLDNHPYEIHFFAANGTPANFVLTNPDTTTEEGCCVQFQTVPDFIASDNWPLSSQACTI